MKLPDTLAIFAFFAGICHVRSTTDAELPIARVVKLIAELKAKVLEDGKNEQASYDQYACWCENTLERKAAEISAEKELIAETEMLIKKLKGEIAAHGAEIAQLKKDIAQNAEAVKDASGVRNKDFKSYEGEKLESENCIGALEHAIKVMTGAGTKKGFLDTTSHQAQLLSIAGTVRRVLKRPSMSQFSSNDVDMVKSFVAEPMEFLRAHAMSAAQVGQSGPNPFGDYAPQSTQIQGILKGMYDAFTADLEKDNAGEAESQKSFEALMATKKQEKETLAATLERQETESAEKTKKLSESQVLKDDTVEQLAADEAFFADTKEACQAKATEWAVRTRLRTEELNGMATAIKILSSGDAKKTFDASATTFLQLSSVTTDRTVLAQKAVGMLKNMATKYKSIEVARIAVVAEAGGHFDKVLSMIDMMMADLREEEQDDIKHRDLCENQQNSNNNEMADLDHEIEKTEAALKRMKNTQKELASEIANLEADIKSTKDSQAELLKFRNKEVKEFRQALKDDADAIALMKQAIAALTKFYKDNKLPLNLAQKPEYTENPDKAPDTWSESYGGRKSESTGILAILEMLVEDAQKEMAEARADDADAQAKYEKQNGALQETLDAQEESKANTETEKADLEEKMDAYEDYKDSKGDDKAASGDAKKALGTECKWVKDHFDKRRKHRKNEIQGLVEAKAFLAGVEAGDDPLPPSMK